MGRKLFAVVVALVAAQVFSGCYVLRELNWDKDKIDPGEKSTATIGLQGAGNTTTAAIARGATGDAGRFFLAVVGEGSGGFDISRPTFDSKDQLGAKEKLTRDDELLDLAFDDGPCSGLLPFRRQQGAPPGRAWRTQDDVESTNKFIESKMRAKVADDAPGGGFFGFVVSGQWIDDGDDVPEDPDTSDDEISCTGFTTTTFKIKGPQGP